MNKYQKLFLDDCERYHDLARKFQDNIEITHPSSVTSRRKRRICGCGDYTSYCTRAVSSVKYYEYQGEKLY